MLSTLIYVVLNMYGAQMQISVEMTELSKKYISCCFIHCFIFLIIFL